MKSEEFPSVLERAALQVWHNQLAWHIEHWDDAQVTAETPLNVVSIGGGAEWRPVNLDRPPEDLPPGRLSLGYDPELIFEHLQTQAILHRNVVDQAVKEWGDYWRFPTREVVRPRLDGEADSYLWLRLMFARDAMSVILSGEPLPFGLASGRPDLTDHAKTLNWLLTTLWDVIGNHWLRLFADRQRAVMRFRFE